MVIRSPVAIPADNPELFGIKVKGRKIKESDEMFYLKEEEVTYSVRFDSKMDNIEAINAYHWGQAKVRPILMLSPNDRR